MTTTAYKAFGRADEAIPLFERAEEIYRKNLPPQEPRWGGLYNNMGLALVDLKRFKEAEELYFRAISVMEQTAEKEPELAITYLNMATCVETELGLETGKSKIAELP